MWSLPRVLSQHLSAFHELSAECTVADVACRSVRCIVHTDSSAFTSMSYCLTFPHGALSDHKLASMGQPMMPPGLVWSGHVFAADLFDSSHLLLTISTRGLRTTKILSPFTAKCCVVLVLSYLALSC